MASSLFCERSRSIDPGDVAVERLAQIDGRLVDRPCLRGGPELQPVTVAVTCVAVEAAQAKVGRKAALNRSAVIRFARWAPSGAGPALVRSQTLAAGLQSQRLPGFVPPAQSSPGTEERPPVLSRGISETHERP